MTYRTLLVRAVAAVAVCAALVTLCYFFVDRQWAYFAQAQHFDRYKLLLWMTYTPIYLESTAPYVIVLAAVRLAWGPLTRLETTLFAAAVNLVVTLALAESLKFFFGRYWPGTWTHDNPSLLRDGDAGYGFHPFHRGSGEQEGWYGSFPSGHTARIVSVMAVVWVAYPRWRWLCVLVAGSVVVGLLGMNYHFVGDVIAGGCLAGITGVYAAHFFRLDGSPAAGQR
jgi:membrane-associated phospholipid phosphatase